MNEYSLAKVQYLYLNSIYISALLILKLYSKLALIAK